MKPCCMRVCEIEFTIFESSEREREIDREREKEREGERESEMGCEL